VALTRDPHQAIAFAATMAVIPSEEEVDRAFRHAWALRAKRLYAMAQRAILADHECKHGRLPGDSTPTCGCWATETPADVLAAPLGEAPPQRPRLAVAAVDARRPPSKTPSNLTKKETPPCS
jgi:hypothetical protein